jgi:hypothetical protein
MRKNWLLIGALAFIAALNAQARIGYTLEQCIAQYGAEDGFETLLHSIDKINPYLKTNPRIYSTGFRVNDVQISVQLLDNKVVEIDYLKKGTLEFSEADVKDLLEKNGGGQKWKLKPNSESEEDENRHYYIGKNADHSILYADAYYHSPNDEIGEGGGYSLTIVDKEGSLRLKDTQEADAKAKEQADKLEAEQKKTKTVDSL